MLQHSARSILLLSIKQNSVHPALIHILGDSKFYKLQVKKISLYSIHTFNLNSDNF